MRARRALALVHRGEDEKGRRPVDFLSHQATDRREQPVERRAVKRSTLLAPSRSPSGADPQVAVGVRRRAVVMDVVPHLRRYATVVVALVVPVGFFASPPRVVVVRLFLLLAVLVLTLRQLGGLAFFGVMMVLCAAISLFVVTLRRLGGLDSFGMMMVALRAADSFFVVIL